MDIFQLIHSRQGTNRPMPKAFYVPMQGLTKQEHAQEVLLRRLIRQGKAVLVREREFTGNSHFNYRLYRLTREGLREAYPDNGLDPYKSVSG